MLYKNLKAKWKYKYKEVISSLSLDRFKPHYKYNYKSTLGPCDNFFFPLNEVHVQEIPA